MSEKVTYEGACHCAAVRFRVTCEPITVAMRCNCSICRRKNPVMSQPYFPKEDFELVSGGLPKYRALIRERTPWPIQNHIWNSNCQESTTEIGRPDYRFMLTRCDTHADLALVRSAAESLRQDQELIQALRGRLSQLKISVDSTARARTRVEVVIQELEAAGAGQ